MHFTELLDVIFRWAHLIAGIMWVGNSMLFNWLDRNLEKDADGSGALSFGRIHMLHSGAFYDVEKKLLAPGEMPAKLHWFKWQNFTTWATGISLFIVVYYLNNTAYLVDPTLHDIGKGVALTLSISAIFVGWLLYDTLWRTLGESMPRLATVISIIGLFASIYVFSCVFSGRAMFMQTGVVIGTIMTGNVWMVIVPSQHELVNATVQGREQDPSFSIRAKQRSIHNNYLTFPLLFIMVSNHFSGAVSHPLNWLILILVMIGGAGIRHFMNVRYLGGGAGARDKGVARSRRRLSGNRDRGPHGRHARAAATGRARRCAGHCEARERNHLRTMRALPRREAVRRHVPLTARERGARDARADPAHVAADLGARGRAEVDAVQQQDRDHREGARGARALDPRRSEG